LGRLDQIKLNRVKTNNLKGFDVRIPLGQLTVVTGVSGSGKSSLVFDSLYGESYRRYVESLSSFARQYLKALPRPDVQAVEGLPAAIAVQQSRQGQNNRSTVGTMTELLDLLRVVFSHVSQVYCCGHLIRKETGRTIASTIAQRLPAGDRCLILAPLVEWKHLKANELKSQLEAQGFTRAFVDDEICRIEDKPAKDLRRGHVVVDRVTVDEANHARLVDSCQLALRLGRGHMRAKALADKGMDQSFEAAMICPDCRTQYHEPSLSLFNFNHPLGACSSCQGFGRVAELDAHKLMPDLELSLADHGVAAWNFGQHAGYYRVALQSAKAHGVDPNKAFEDYTEDEWSWLFNGDETGRFSGIYGYFAWLDTKKYKPHYRIHAARYKTYVVCGECNGKRLSPISLRYKVAERDMGELGELTLDQLSDWFAGLIQMSEQQPSQAQALSLGVREALDEAVLRLNYLKKVGLSYLSLNRLSRSLSGGELQRINMARSLGNQLTATLFCLDEPSSGLHPRDSHRLLEVLCELRDQGNTVVLVEHENALIDGADHLIEIGPKAGADGGELVYQGDAASYERKPVLFKHSLWAENPKTQFIRLTGARTHNLKGIDVRIPLNAITTVCGVSGSGKTSLIQHTLYPLVCEEIGKETGELDSEALADGVSCDGDISRIKDIVMVSQEGIGRSTRSSIATYLGIYKEVRDLLAQTPLARARKYKPGYFSFNVAGGRCETCKGLGTVVEDLSFLGDMDVICPSCEGQRFQKAALEVQYKGKHILDILAMTAAEARGFFKESKPISRILDIVIDMGLGYLSLGQHTSSFSGGEAQRLKTTKFLLEKHNDGSRIFIFDEPTTGLSDQDVTQLMRQMKVLVDGGHTVIVVEHHLGVIKSSDWVIEIGPDAADAGGELVYEGGPVEMKDKKTHTARFMKY
jgi:excinuclease ABC subunit A